MVSRGGEKIEKFGRACQKREGKPALCYAESGEIGGSGTGRGRSPAPHRIQGGGTGGGTSGLRGSFAEGGARGCLTLSDGQKISLDQTVWTPERQRREALYGMSAPSLERWRRSLAWTFWNRRDFMTRAQEGRTR